MANKKEKRGPGRFLTTRTPIGQHVKMFKQIQAPPAYVKQRTYPKSVAQEGDDERCAGLRFRKDETIFAAYDNVEMRKSKILVVASSDFVHASKSLFWPDVRMLVDTDLNLIQSVSMAIDVHRLTKKNPITMVFAGINDHSRSRVFLSRLRGPTTSENAVWPAKKDLLESKGKIIDVLKEGAFPKKTPKAVFALSPGYAHLPDGLKFVYAMVALFSEGKYDKIISAPNREVEARNLRPLRAQLPAVWSDIINAMRGFKDHLLHMQIAQIEARNLRRSSSDSGNVQGSVVQGNGDQGRRGKEAKRQRNESSLGSYEFANEARVQQVTAFDSSINSIGH